MRRVTRRDPGMNDSSIENRRALCVRLDLEAREVLCVTNVTRQMTRIIVYLM
jgi:hypothetical protein